MHNYCDNCGREWCRCKNNTMNRHTFYKFSSMDNWYPVIREIEGVKTPKTERVNIGDIEALDDAPVESIQMVVRDLGVPVFMRTDASSHKHQMEKASKLSSLEEQDIRSSFKRLIMHNAMAGGGLPFKSLYLREWLDLKEYFKAFDQTPICPELRFFIHNGEILQHHFYWPKEAIEFHGDTERPEDWESLWNECMNEALVHAASADRQAQLVAEKFRGQGFWSVDFALDQDNNWFCIDMARGEVSWHPKNDLVDKPVTTLDDYEEMYEYE